MNDTGNDRAREVVTAALFEELQALWARLDSHAQREARLAIDQRVGRDQPRAERRMPPRILLAMRDTRHGVVALHDPLVRFLAGRWTRSRADLRAELEQAGRVGLLVAVESFEPQRGLPFGRWARRHVQRELQLAWHAAAGLNLSLWDVGLQPRLRRVQRQVLLEGGAVTDSLGEEVVAACREQVPGVSGATVRRVLAASRPVALDRAREAHCPVLPAAEHDAVRRVILEKAQAALAQLAAADRDLVIARLGLLGDDEAGWRELAARTGSPESTLRSRYQRAIDELRAALAGGSSARPAAAGRLTGVA